MSLLKALVLIAGQIVQVPAADTVADFNNIANKPSTLSGYGIAASNVLSTLLTVDGAGSGLDADLLDGNSSAFFLDIGNATGTLDPARINANTVPVAKLTFAATARILGRATAGAGQGEELTGAQVLSIAGALAASSYTAADVLAKMLTVDGAGSGLDADLLDGLSSAAFAKLTGDQTFTAGDLKTTRAGGAAQGILFLGDQSGGSRYIYYNATSYVLPGAELLVNGGTAWHSLNDGAGSGLDADLLDGNSSAFYLDAGNLTGTLLAAQLAVNSIPVNRIAQIGDQRILGNTSGATGSVSSLTAAQVAAIIDSAFVSLTVTGQATVTSNINFGGALVGTAANLDIRKDTAAAADTEAVRIGGGGVIGSSRGGTGQFFGINHATQPGNILMQAGTGSFKPSGANIGGILFGTKVFDLPSVTQGVANAAAQTTVTVTGAAVGDIAMATITSITTAKWIVSAIVTAANTVTVTFSNLTAAAIDPASGTLNCFVLQAP